MGRTPPATTQPRATQSYRAQSLCSAVACSGLLRLSAAKWGGRRQAPSLGPATTACSVLPPDYPRWQVAGRRAVRSAQHGPDGLKRRRVLAANQRSKDPCMPRQLCALSSSAESAGGGLEASERSVPFRKNHYLSSPPPAHPTLHSPSNGRHAGPRGRWPGPRHHQLGQMWRPAKSGPEPTRLKLQLLSSPLSAGFSSDCFLKNISPFLLHSKKDAAVTTM